MAIPFHLLTIPTAPEVSICFTAMKSGQSSSQSGGFIYLAVNVCIDMENVWLQQESPRSVGFFHIYIYIYVNLLEGIFGFKHDGLES